MYLFKQEDKSDSFFFQKYFILPNIKRQNIVYHTIQEITPVLNVEAKSIFFFTKWKNKYLLETEAVQQCAIKK